MPSTTTASLGLIEAISRQTRQTPGAVADAVPVNVEQIEDREQHVRVFLRVVREYQMAISFELAVDSADEFDRYLLMRVAMGIPHVGSLVDQHVIEDVAVAVGNVTQLLAEVRQVLHVIPIDPGIVRLVCRNVAVMRRSMPGSIKAGR